MQVLLNVEYIRSCLMKTNSKACQYYSKKIASAKRKYKWLKKLTEQQNNN